jgi:Mn-dependent DtxR family transcriptional regulator
LKIDHGLRIRLEKGPKKLKILRLISRSTNPLGSDTISKKLKMYESNVIRILNELEKGELVNCVTGRKRDRRYEITEYGRLYIDSM